MMKLFITLIAVLLGTSVATAQTLDFDEAVRQSLSQPSGMFPVGVPPTYSWYDGSFSSLPFGPDPPPAGFTAVTGWSQFYPQQGFTNGSCTIFVKGWKTYVHKSAGGWLQVQDGSSIGGGYYNADFVGDVATSMTINNLGGGEFSFIRPETGKVSHFWADPRGTYAADTIDGVFALYAAKMDDAACNLIGNVGYDYWRSMSAPWPDNASPGEGAWVKLTTSYQYFYFTNFNRAQLVADMPPPFQGVVAPPPPPPPPVGDAALSTMLKQMSDSFEAVIKAINTYLHK